MRNINAAVWLIVLLLIVAVLALIVFPFPNLASCIT
jgi:hypothetical protein